MYREGLNYLCLGYECHSHFHTFAADAVTS